MTQLGRYPWMPFTFSLDQHDLIKNSHLKFVHKANFLFVAEVPLTNTDRKVERQDTCVMCGPHLLLTQLLIVLFYIGWPQLRLYGISRGASRISDVI